MICSFAAAAALSSQNPAKILSGNYHPPFQNDNFIQALGSSDMGKRALPINGDALTVALDVVQIWAVMLTLSFTLIIFFFLAFCVCAKRENSYDDFENTQGITTVKVCRNGGENGVHMARGTSTVCSQRATDETSEASSRYTHQRELPAIPTSASASNRESVQKRPTTNGIGQGGSIKPIGGVQVIPAGAMKSGGRAAVIKESVTVPIDKPGGGNKIGQSSSAHSYVMVSHSKKEHAYAKVAHGKTQEPEVDTDSYDDPSGKICDNLQKASNLQTSQAAVKNRSSTVGIEQTTDRNSSVMPSNEPAVVIPAAMAISGRTRANEELPYMTPASLQQQQNYSGDSHDSRGYTSISVREPLAALKARQQQEGRQPSAVPTSKGQELESEGYYMTVSDDSADETYACIDENSRNGGSETYARINLPPSSAADHNLNSAAAPLSPTTQETSPPAPPSVDSLKHVVHSRQASAGSAASTGLSSPNAERRVTKSPLPPVPQGDPDLYSKDTQDCIDKQSHDITDTTGGRLLEEMYAKVNKKRSTHSRGNSSGGLDNDGVLSNNSSRRSSTDVSKQLCSPTTVKSMSSSLIETSTESSVTRKMPSDISMSWSGIAVSTKKATSYDKVPSQTKTYSRETSDPGYETVKSTEPPYASVEQPENYPSYEVVRHQGTSDLESEHGYETLRHKESEPGYETVQDVTKARYNNRNSTNASDYEAGYETVNRSTDAGYESVQAEGRGDYDPGYEELSGIHARSTSECDPNYEQLKFNTSNSECGYEAISKGTEGNYELVSDYDTQEKQVQGDNSIPLYATVNKKNKISRMEERPKEIIGVKEKEHVSLIQVSDANSQEDKTTSGGHLPPLITGAIIKCNPETLLLNDAPKKTETYPVTESPEDVELPSPEMENLEAVSSYTIPARGIDTASSALTQDFKNLLESSSMAGVAKPLDVDLITGCYSNSTSEMVPVLSTEPIIDFSNMLKYEKNGTNLMPNGGGMQIDLLLESLPPPPTSMIDDLCNQAMPLPPPVDDICGSHDLHSQLLITNNDCGTTQSDKDPLSPELANILQPSLNGNVNGFEAMIQPPISNNNDFPSLLMDVAPPPQMDVIEASLAATNSTITVTVNPMANMEESSAPPVSALIRAALSSESSGSTATNGGSMESVVTVDVKNGIEVSTSIPPTNSSQMQPTQPAPSTTVSEAKDGHEELTPV